MEKQEFDQILKEAGITNQKAIDKFWANCPFPHGQLIPEILRRAAKSYVEDFPIYSTTGDPSMEDFT